MIAVAAVARQWRATLLGLLLLFVALVMMLAVLEEGHPSDESLLEGIPAEEITGGGITIDRAPQEPDLPVTRDAAVQRAVRTYPGGVPRQVVLVRLQSAGDPANRVAWAINFDPSTVAGSPPSGRDAPAGPCETGYAFVFIDARTGDFIFGGDKTGPVSASPLGLP